MKQPGKQPKNEPVFLYFSACCSVLAEKVPCERSAEDKKEHKFSQSPLGSWRCSKCRKSCKVTRTSNAA